MTRQSYYSLIGKHCYFVHSPARSVQRIHDTRRGDGQSRFHLWIHTQDPAGPQKCDWIAGMPPDTNWVIRNYQQSEEWLHSSDQARSLGAHHAELAAAMLQDAVQQGINPNRIWFTGRNEPQPEEMPFLNDYEIARMDRATELGQKLFGNPNAVQLVLWNIPEGNPATFEYHPQTACNWDVLQPSRARALQLSPDGDLRILYGYHAYFGWQGPNEMWGGDDMKLYAIPYRISHCSWPEKKWFFSEGGCDEGVNQNMNKDAWRTVPKAILSQYGLPDSEEGRAQLYANHLQWLEKLFILDGRVVGWVLFTDDYDNRQWWKFDTNVPCLDAIMAPYLTSEQSCEIWGDLAVARWQPLIEHRAEQHGLDPRVVATIIKLESGGRVDAVGAAGDTGLMQVIDGEHMNGRPRHTLLLNPDQNVKAGCAVLKQCLDAFAGKMPEAIAAYNRGIATIQQSGTQEPRAQAYLARFQAAWSALWPGQTCPVQVHTSADQALCELLAEKFGAKFQDLRASLIRSSDPANQYAQRSEASLARIIIHHTASPSATTTWQGVANYDVQSNKWPGCSYHIGISPDGTVALLNDLTTVSYHAAQANGDSLAICLAGNFHPNVPNIAEEKPTEQALKAAHEVILVLDEYLKRELPLYSHRDVGQTDCPGDNLQPRVAGLRDGRVETDDKERMLLLTAGREHQLMHLNPQAALQKAIAADGFVPNSDEFDLRYDGQALRCQSAQQLADSYVRVYWCVVGDWSNVHFVD